jgi:hypothetical protein
MVARAKSIRELFLVALTRSSDGAQLAGVAGTAWPRRMAALVASLDELSPVDRPSDGARLAVKAGHLLQTTMVGNNQRGIPRMVARLALVEESSLVDRPSNGMRLADTAWREQSPVDRPSNGARLDGIAWEEPSQVDRPSNEARLAGTAWEEPSPVDRAPNGSRLKLFAQAASIHESSPVALARPSDGAQLAGVAGTAWTRRMGAQTVSSDESFPVALARPSDGVRLAVGAGAGTAWPQRMVAPSASIDESPVSPSDGVWLAARAVHLQLTTLVGNNQTSMPRMAVRPPSAEESSPVERPLNWVQPAGTAWPGCCLLAAAPCRALPQPGPLSCRGPGIQGAWNRCCTLMG